MLRPGAQQSPFVGRDALASEARLASFVAIATGQIPQEHWLHLGRPQTRIGDMPALMSWSGTMFEYLMPPLFLESYPNTLMDESCRVAIEQQISGETRAIEYEDEDGTLQALVKARRELTTSEDAIRTLTLTAPRPGIAV